jgi:hypothetical protein
MVQGIGCGILHVYSALIDNPGHLRALSPTDDLLLLRQVVAGSIPVSRSTPH